jgi:hypothetical protein
VVLKRFYKTPPGWEAIKNVHVDGKLIDPGRPVGECLNLPPLDYLVVIQANPHKQTFSTRIVERGIREGWIMLAKDKIVLDVRPEALVYTIKRGPGHYCCHCGVKQDGERESRIHILSVHKDVVSPDKRNPSGYCRINAYECVREGVTEGTKEQISWLRRVLGGG